jgi:hypothetical protein
MFGGRQCGGTLLGDKRLIEVERRSTTPTGEEMGEWVLALNITSCAPGEICDVSMSNPCGFWSNTTCEAAAQTFASCSVTVVDQARMQAGMLDNDGRSSTHSFAAMSSVIPSQSDVPFYI